MNELTKKLSGFQTQLLLAIHGIAEDSLRTRERADAWSIADVIAHFGDVELLMGMRIRLALVEDEPEFQKFAQNAWIDRLHRNDAIETRLEDFWSLRRQNVRLLESLTPAELARKGIHPTRGPMSVLDLAEMLVEHQERHLGQIERIKSALALRSTDAPNLAGVVASSADRAAFRSPGPGVRIHDLWSGGVRRALQVELDAGARWPGLDQHVPGPEEVFVHAGDFHDGRNRYERGAFIHHPAGTSHSPVSENGCVLFVFYPEG